MSERRLLLQRFHEFPTLANSVLAASSFEFPERIDPRRDVSRGTVGAETSHRSRLNTSRPSAGAIANLRDALQLAADKPEFGRTTIDQWENIMQFAGSKIRRRSQLGIFEIATSQKDDWSDHDPLNISARSANCWFNNVLLHRIMEGAPYRHGHAILGSQGCGKSTLIKYLISKNAERIRNKKVVFSRFEFLKFWSEWRNAGGSRDQSLTAYMTFIHLRDLLLDRFFDFLDGTDFQLKFTFRSLAKREEEIESVTRAARLQAQIYGQTFNEDTVRFRIANCVAEACKSNHDLMNYIKTLEVGDRMTLIGALWEDRCVVTIFDGMDALQLEDAFQKTDQWHAVKYIIRHRRQLSTPTRSREHGINVENDSIVVIRKSTAAFLEFESARDVDELGLQFYYHVLPINSLAAMASVVRRALAELSDFAGASPVMIEQYVFKLMKVLQRTMLAIGRSEGGSAALEDIYNLFDGNLRDLFKFAASTIEWSCREMLRSNFLDSEDYFGDVPKLIDALSSSRGSDFLRQKSYRVIEQILLQDGVSFENAAAIVTTKSKLLGSNGVPSTVVRSNPDHFGQIDNIFNYLNVGDMSDVDAHTFLEKVRIVQLLWSKALPDEALADRMQDTFGYKPWDDLMLIKLMLKTGFIAAEIDRKSLRFEVQLRSTAKAKLCVTSLIGNLAYIEHVFHRTLFPEVLIGHISDKARDRSTDWAIASIRNAFIFLTYFRHIEGHAANGVAVPPEHRLFERARRRVTASLERIISPFDRPDHPDRDLPVDRAYRASEATAICTGALKEIERTLKVWRDAGAVARARTAA